MIGLDAVGVLTAAAAAEHEFQLVAKALGLFDILGRDDTAAEELEVLIARRDFNAAFPARRTVEVQGAGSLNVPPSTVR
jgi:hypothetical protein